MRINKTSPVESVLSESFNKTVGGGAAADMQSNGASGIGDDMDIRRIIKDCGGGGVKPDPNNGQLGDTAGCMGIGDAAVASVSLPDSSTDLADYMNDAYGELCLNSVGCANGSDALTAAAAAAVASVGEEGGVAGNMTHLLLEGIGGEYNESFNYCMNHAGNISYLNISCEFELEYATPLYGFCIPILLFVTVTANLLIVIVLSRRSMATPTNSVLMGECNYYFIIHLLVIPAPFYPPALMRQTVLL